MRQVCLVLWTFLSAFAMFHELLLFICYAYEYRQKSLGNEKIRRASGQPLHPVSPSLTLHIDSVRRGAILLAQPSLVPRTLLLSPQKERNSRESRRALATRLGPALILLPVPQSRVQNCPSLDCGAGNGTSPALAPYIYV